MQKITMEEFRVDPSGNTCSEESYLGRCMTVRSLMNDGHSNLQIRCLKPLIFKELNHAKIKSLFTPDTKAEEIEETIREMESGNNA